VKSQVKKREIRRKIRKINIILENETYEHITRKVNEIKNIPTKENNSNIDIVNLQESDISNRNTKKEIKREIPIVNDEKLIITDVLNNDLENNEILGDLVNKVESVIRPRDWEKKVNI
jgi:tyrosine-protein phosphatase YwqE